MICSSDFLAPDAWRVSVSNVPMRFTSNKIFIQLLIARFRILLASDCLVLLLIFNHGFALVIEGVGVAGGVDLSILMF